MCIVVSLVDSHLATTADLAASGHPLNLRMHWLMDGGLGMAGCHAAYGVLCGTNLTAPAACRVELLCRMIV